MHEIASKHPDVQVVDVNTSDPASARAAIRFNISMIPHSFFFDGSGELITHFRGIKTHEQLAEMLTEAGYPVEAPPPGPVQLAPKAGSTSAAASSSTSKTAGSTAAAASPPTSETAGG